MHAWPERYFPGWLGPFEPTRQSRPAMLSGGPASRGGPSDNRRAPSASTSPDPRPAPIPANFGEARHRRGRRRAGWCAPSCGQAGMVLLIVLAAPAPSGSPAQPTAERRGCGRGKGRECMPEIRDTRGPRGNWPTPPRAIGEGNVEPSTPRRPPRGARWRPRRRDRTPRPSRHRRGRRAAPGTRRSARNPPRPRTVPVLAVLFPRSLFPGAKAVTGSCGRRRQSGRPSGAAAERG